MNITKNNDFVPAEAYNSYGLASTGDIYALGDVRVSTNRQASCSSAGVTPMQPVSQGQRRWLPLQP